MEIPWITIILGVLVSYFIYWWNKKNANYWKDRGVPFLKPLPIIGSMKDVVLQKRTLTEVTSDIYRQFPNDKYCGIHMFTTPILVIRDIDLINQILIKDFTHFQNRGFSVDENLELMNASLASLSGERWKILRHKMTPTFTSGKMKLMFNKMKECSEEAAKYLIDKRGVDIDSRDFLFKYMVNVITDISFGIKADAFNDKIENNQFVQTSRKLFQPSLKIQIAQLITFFAPSLRKLLKVKFADNEVNEFFKNLTQDLIKLRKDDKTKRNDFLQLMLDEREKEINILGSAADGKIDKDVTPHAEEPEDLELIEHLKNIKFDKNAQIFSDHIIAAQTLIFIAGGTETTASTLSFALYELAINEKIQNRAQEQIDEILQSQDLTYESMKKLTYLDQILNEVMRLRPAAGFLPRICTKDYQIPGTDLLIPKGNMVAMSVAGIHKNPEFFPEPDIFNPDRFENMDNIPKGVFFPFGGGPRICIAMRLAMLKMKVFLAIVLSKNTVKLSDKTRTPLKMNPKSILQHVEGGLWLKFEERQK